MTTSATPFTRRLISFFKEFALWIAFIFVASMILTRIALIIHSNFNKTDIAVTTNTTGNNHILTVIDSDLSSSYVNLILRDIPTESSKTHAENKKKRKTNYSAITSIGNIEWSIRCGKNKLSGSINKPTGIYSNIQKEGFVRLFSTDRKHIGCRGTVSLLETTVPLGSAAALRTIKDVHLAFDYTDDTERILGGLTQLIILLSAASFSWGSGVPFALLTLIISIVIWERLKHFREKQNHLNKEN